MNTEARVCNTVPYRSTRRLLLLSAEHTYVIHHVCAKVVVQYVVRANLNDRMTDILYMTEYTIIMYFQLAPPHYWLDHSQCMYYVVYILALCSYDMVCTISKAVECEIIIISCVLPSLILHIILFVSVFLCIMHTHARAASAGLCVYCI